MKKLLLGLLLLPSLGLNAECRVRPGFQIGPCPSGQTCVKGQTKVATTNYADPAAYCYSFTGRTSQTAS